MSECINVGRLGSNKAGLGVSADIKMFASHLSFLFVVSVAAATRRNHER